jgi:hypothetical protein
LSVALHWSRRPRPLVGDAIGGRQREHGRPDDRPVFELRRRLDLVRRERQEPVRRQVAAPRIADEDARTASDRKPEPGQDASGQRALIPGIRGEQHVDLGRFVVEQVATGERDLDAIRPGVEPDRGFGVGVDVGGCHRRGAGQRGGDRDEPAARRKVEDTLALDLVRVLLDESPKRQAACPGERPERDRGPGDPEGRFGGSPDRPNLAGKMEAHARNARDGLEPRVMRDERPPVRQRDSSRSLARLCGGLALGGHPHQHGRRGRSVCTIRPLPRADRAGRHTGQRSRRHVATQRGSA